MGKAVQKETCCPHCPHCPPGRWLPGYRFFPRVLNRLERQSGGSREERLSRELQAAPAASSGTVC